MISLCDLQTWLDAYMIFDPKFDAAKVDPYMTNGLMVRGNEQIQKIGFAVSASLSIFQKAQEAGCQAVITHHSMNLPPYNRYDVIYQNRLAFLLHHDISLLGYHYLLDAHPEIGNNVEILKTIVAIPTNPFAIKGQTWGWSGKMEGVAFAQILSTLTPQLSPRSVIYPYGAEKIHTVVVVSGMGSPSPSMIHELVEKKVDLYITGEPHEWIQELCREAKINFIAGGHYHTEVFGIRALMQKIHEKFTDIEIIWLDALNEV